MCLRNGNNNKNKFIIILITKYVIMYQFLGQIVQPYKQACTVLLFFCCLIAF